MAASFAVRGAVVAVSADEVGGITVLPPDTLVVVGAGGEVLGTGEEALRVAGLHEDDVLRLGAHQALLPGFVDCHAHAPQYPYTGTATGVELMEWLETRTFPAEAKLASVATAREVYAKAVGRLLRLGTTTACLFATAHVEATKALADVCAEAGCRAFVGKVCMDRCSPDFYVEATEDSVRGAEDVIRYVRALGLDRVRPVVTPRFVPTCTRGLLASLGELARREGVFVQSHISESDGECAFTAQLEGGARDAEVLDNAGLLTGASVMAHGTKLTEAELDLLAERGTSIAHCPLSNFFFGDASLRVRDCLRRGVKVGLGSDVAGGVSPSMVVSARNAVVASRAVVHAESARLQHEEGVEPCAATVAADKAHGLVWKDALWMATRGGALALGLGDTLGCLTTPGHRFDALVVNLDGAGVYDVFEADTPIDRLEKFFNLGDDRLIDAVYVDGACVSGMPLER